MRDIRQVILQGKKLHEQLRAQMLFEFHPDFGTLVSLNYLHLLSTSSMFVASG